jgi:hypothetical protein
MILREPTTLQSTPLPLRFRTIQVPHAGVPLPLAMPPFRFLSVDVSMILWATTPPRISLTSSSASSSREAKFLPSWVTIFWISSQKRSSQALASWDGSCEIRSLNAVPTLPPLERPGFSWLACAQRFWTCLTYGRNTEIWE